MGTGIEGGQPWTAEEGNLESILARLLLLLYVMGVKLGRMESEHEVNSQARDGWKLGQ